jgi:hypothetical protein
MIFVARDRPVAGSWVLVPTHQLLKVVFRKDGKPADEAMLKTCFPCHAKIEARDFVFPRYAP